jgi:hypothetical protein
VEDQGSEVKGTQYPEEARTQQETSATVSDKTEPRTETLIEKEFRWCGMSCKPLPKASRSCLG